MITDERMLANLAAINLAKASINKVILKLYAPQFDQRLLQMFHVKDHPKGWVHRTSETWTKSDEAVFAVRAHRIFIEIFAANRDYQMTLGAQDLWEWYFTYSQLYPADEMTPNRLHYMISMIRSGTLRIKESCSHCNQTYVIHQDMYTLSDCAICRRVKSIALAPN